MGKLKKVFGKMISEYGRDFAEDAIRDILYHEVKAGKMKFKESERILKALEK